MSVSSPAVAHCDLGVQPAVVVNTLRLVPAYLHCGWLNWLDLN
jgi:hypothetical protein